MRARPFVSGPAFFFGVGRSLPRRTPFSFWPRCRCIFSLVSAGGRAYRFGPPLSHWSGGVDSVLLETGRQGKSRRQQQSCIHEHASTYTYLLLCFRMYILARTPLVQDTQQKKKIHTHLPGAMVALTTEMADFLGISPTVPELCCDINTLWL